MNRRLSTISLTVALVATACTGGDVSEQAVEAPLTTEPVTRSVQEASPATTTIPVPTTTTTTVLAPSTLAFISSADVGRLFALDRDIMASTSAGGDPDASPVTAGTVVQASSLRSRNDVLWVRIESTVPDGSTLGWVPADTLVPTAESIFTEDSSSARQFRQVASAVENDALGVFAVPGSGTPLGFLSEGEIAMHGGVSALTPSGDIWLDIIDPGNNARLGWVPARSFRGLSGGAIQDNDGNPAARSPIAGVNYGQALTGGVTASGCNAVQVTFANSSASAGLAMFFGTDSPIERELSTGGYTWSGTSIFGPAGSDLTITIPSSTTRDWFFAPLDNDAQASFSSVNDDGRAVADDVLQISVPAGSCAVTVTAPGAPVLDSYVNDLPESEREAAIAQFEADLAEFEGRQAPLIPGEESEDAEGDAAGDDADVDPEAEAGAEGDAPTTDTAVTDPAVDAAAQDPAAATDPAAPAAEATPPAANPPADPVAEGTQAPPSP